MSNPSEISDQCDPTMPQETGVPTFGRRQQPKPIPFGRRVELMNLAEEAAKSAVSNGVQPHEVRLFLGLQSTLLDKNEYC